MAFRFKRCGSTMPWYEKRILDWDKEKQRQEALGAGDAADTATPSTALPITVTLDRGKKKGPKALEAVGGVTTPFEVNPAVASNAIGAIVNMSEPWGLHDPLPSESCHVKFLTAADADVDSNTGQPEVRDAAQTLLWHSAAHLLGQAVEKVAFLNQGAGQSAPDVLLCDGPPLVDGSVEGGFFYEMALPPGVTIGDSMFPDLEKCVNDIVKEKQPFEKLVVSRDFAEKMFSYNPFKVEMLESISKDESIMLYRNGPFVDLCRGPHVPNTSVFKSVKFLKTSASHWKSADGGGGAANADSSSPPLLQRVYGVAFGTKVGMKTWSDRLDAAKERDHRKIGARQELFMFHPTSPGSAFMLPHGTRIYNRLIDILRREYQQHGFEEIMTPMVYKLGLWETSGHLQNYQEDMYMVKAGVPEDGGGTDTMADAALDSDSVMGLKPMNCPGHCLVYKQKTRSYRSLPLRVADFSPIHRNELSGALSGLTRLRKFQQDDGHIFCTREQMKQELLVNLDMVETLYERFGFGFRMCLSTRPDKFMGEPGLWDEAEATLEDVLNEKGFTWSHKHGDGAFYGPKIDVVVTDAIGREHQCATIQLDFQMPRRFGLEYQDSDNTLKCPVMIHRAVLGSLERMFAILCEHYGGRWPIWLSPRQIAVCPISDGHIPHGREIVDELVRNNFYTDMMDKEGMTLPKIVKQAQMAQYNYILVVGDKEVENGTVNVRTRDGEILGEMSIDEVLSLCRKDMIV